MTRVEFKSLSLNIRKILMVTFLVLTQLLLSAGATAAPSPLDLVCVRDVSDPAVYEVRTRSGLRLGDPPWSRKWDFNQADCNEVLTHAKNELICGISDQGIVPMPSVGHGPYYSTGGMVDDNGFLESATEAGKPNPANPGELQQYRKELAECSRMVEEAKYPFSCGPDGSGGYAVFYHMGETLSIQTTRPTIQRPGSTIPFPVGPELITSYATLDDCLQAL